MVFVKAQEFNTLYCVGMGLYREAESLENKVVRYLRNEQEVFPIKN